MYASDQTNYHMLSSENRSTTAEINADKTRLRLPSIANTVSVLWRRYPVPQDGNDSFVSIVETKQLEETETIHREDSQEVSVMHQE